MRLKLQLFDYLISFSSKSLIFFSNFSTGSCSSQSYPFGKVFYIICSVLLAKALMLIGLEGEFLMFLKKSFP